MKRPVITPEHAAIVDRLYPMDAPNEAVAAAIVAALVTGDPRHDTAALVAAADYLSFDSDLGEIVRGVTLSTRGVAKVYSARTGKTIFRGTRRECNAFARRQTRATVVVVGIGRAGRGEECSCPGTSSVFVRGVPELRNAAHAAV